MTKLLPKFNLPSSNTQSLKPLPKAHNPLNVISPAISHIDRECLASKIPQESNPSLIIAVRIGEFMETVPFVVLSLTRRETSIGNLIADLKSKYLKLR